jgi:hypothetical protein
MIWAALLIGATVFLAVSIIRAPTEGAGTRHWLVLPDEPPAKPAALPALPAIPVIRPAWSSSDESWRADKPLKPWFQSPGSYAADVAFGAISLDLTALGLGVPEIMPTHWPVHDRPDHADAVWPAAPPEPTHAAHDGFGLDLAAWDQSDFIVPSWDRSDFIVPSWEHAPSHDWWA